jgi:hypothetical protein
MGVVMQMVVIPHHQQIARLPVVIVIYVVIIVHAVLVEMVFCLHVAHRICGQSPQTQLTEILCSEVTSRTSLRVGEFFCHPLYFQATTYVFN